MLRVRAEAEPITTQTRKPGFPPGFLFFGGPKRTDRQEHRGLTQSPTRVAASGRVIVGREGMSVWSTITPRSAARKSWNPPSIAPILVSAAPVEISPRSAPAIGRSKPGFERSAASLSVADNTCPLRVVPVTAHSIIVPWSEPRFSDSAIRAETESGPFPATVPLASRDRSSKVHAPKGTQPGSVRATAR
jgi:hypothetical protein